MPQVWTPDDLRFADIRAAHCESAEQVAADLLAAAGQPRARLQGVTVAEASLRAADLLIAAGDRERAATIARQVLRDVRGRPEELAAACMLARAGDPNALEALAAQALNALQDRPGESAIIHAVAAAFGLAGSEQFGLAERVAGEAAAAYALWKTGSGRRADPGGTLGNLTERARQIVLTARQDFQDQANGRDKDEPGMRSWTLPPWPVLSGSCLLWWPQAEYQRIVRQVPELRSVLGATWRDHTTTVESAMLELAGPAFRPGGASPFCLIAADFGHFYDYLRLSDADPRLATTMTGCTAHLISLAETGGDGTSQPIPWPPAERSRCWCGSKARYRRCCEPHGSQALR